MKGGAGPTCPSEARVGLADRAVEGETRSGSPSSILQMGEVITHRQELVDHFLNFCCPQGRKKIGAEFEKLGVFVHSGKAIPYTGERGVAAVLSGLSQRFGWKSIKEGNNIIGLSRNTAEITLEPGEQIELSGSPLDNIHQIKRELENHLIEIKSISDSLGIRWLGLGIQPVSLLALRI